jgi:hypothetical protein
LAGFCESGDEPLGSGATELVIPFSDLLKNHSASGIVHDDSLCEWVTTCLAMVAIDSHI